MELEERAGNAHSSIEKQVLATILANMSSLTVGVMLTVAIHNSKISHGPFCLAIPIAFILGLLLSYSCCECYGRKATLRLSMIPFIFCLVLITLVERPAWMRKALCVEIFGNAMWSFTLPLYAAEISCGSIRGALNSVHIIFFYIGRMIAELITLKWTIHQATYILIFFPLITMIGTFWLPESPIFLVKVSRIDEATRSLLWLRNNDEGYVQNELLRIKQTVQQISNSGSCLACLCDGIGTLKDVLGVSANRRSFFIALGLLTGQLVVLWNGSPWQFHPLMRHAHDAKTLVRCATIPVLGSALATILVNSVGRRSLLLISCVIVSLDGIIDLYKMMNFTTGQDDDVTMWLYYAVKCLFSIAYHSGLGSLPSVIAVEVFQRKVLSLGYMICLFISWIVFFTYLWLDMARILETRLVRELIQLVLCVCLSFFIYFYVPETKGNAIE